MFDTHFRKTLLTPILSLTTNTKSVEEETKKLLVNSEYVATTNDLSM